MTVLYCDRCKSTKIVRTVNIPCFLLNTISSRSKDLCENCLESLNKWLEPLPEQPK